MNLMISVHTVHAFSPDGLTRLGGLIAADLRHRGYSDVEVRVVTEEEFSRRVADELNKKLPGYFA